MYSRRELRVARAALVGRVGDVLQAEQREHLARERLRRRRVVVGARAPRRRSGPWQPSAADAIDACRCRCAASPRPQLACRRMAGDGAELHESARTHRRGSAPAGCRRPGCGACRAPPRGRSRRTRRRRDRACRRRSPRRSACSRRASSSARSPDSSTGRRPRSPACRRRSRRDPRSPSARARRSAVAAPSARARRPGRGESASTRAQSPADLVVVTKNLRLSAEEVARAASRTNAPFLRGLVRQCDAGDLARPRRASQLRDSAGFSPASLRNTGRGICARLSENTLVPCPSAQPSSRSATKSSPATSRTRTPRGSRNGSSHSACASSSLRRCRTRSRRSSSSSAASAPACEHLIVTGGLGGTPDDITREAMAAAFEVRQVEVPELAAELRARFPRHPDYAARWAQLPAGSRPLVNPHGGAPGFQLENVWVLPGLPVGDGGDVRPLRRRAAR